jgi:prepilin-type N-terminal cleavage/methylation domain-containing protein
MKINQQGFTLIEILITITVIAAIGTLGLAGACAAKRKAKCAVEINAARNLITAYLSHAADNSGRVLAGYQIDQRATNIEGDSLHYPMNARYPWRLAPHVPKIDGVMLFNGNESALKSENRDYLVSVHPNLGLNATLVGGHFGTGSPLSPTPKMIAAFGKFHLSHLTESSAPEKLLVFASARSGGNEQGYFEVRPPNLNRPVWSSVKYSRESEPSAHGFTDLRWDGKAVCAMLGGNIELLDETSLRDMRRWSIQAERANETDFLIRPQEK